MRKWINLKDFGLEFKKVILPDNSVFPVIIVSDIHKYNNSGAMPLSELNNKDNETKFIRLSGERKGRNTNTPIYMLSNSFHNNSQGYSIKESFSKLLNIELKEVEKYYEQQEESEFEINNGFADFSGFDQAIQKTTQRFFGNRLYIVKNKQEPISLINLSKKIIENQHPLFPKPTVANIPLMELDAFGLNSTIIDKAFTNPDDALKNGYTLADLETVQLQGDYAVLPISLNKDKSIDLILDANKIPQLAYSNYSWQKNITLIEDYNALISLRESSRALLNTKSKDIFNSELMDQHLVNLSLCFQNYNAAQLATKLHKPIKFNANGTYSYVLKNADGNWRYIEKTGFEKKDMPLSWDNYQKAIIKLVEHHNLVTSTLGIGDLNKKDSDLAISVVLKNQSALFEKFTQVVGVNDVEKDNVIVIDVNSKKISQSEFNAINKNFKRQVGRELQEQRIQSFINEIESVEGGANILNSMGEIASVGDINKTIESITDESKFKDILDVYEENPEPLNQAVAVTSDFIYSSNTTLDIENELNRTDLLSTNIGIDRYKSLPRGISDLIDDNYEEANEKYNSLQHINLSSIPYWERSIDQAKKLRDEIYSNIYKNFDDRVDLAVLNPDEPIVGIDAKEQEYLNNAEKTIQELNEHLDFERIKANILAYQFKKLTAKSDNNTYGNLVFNQDSDGVFVPFKSQTDYNNAVLLVKNDFDKKNAENGALILDVSATRQKIDEFIASNYMQNKIDINNLWNNLALFNSTAKKELQFVDLESTDLTADHLSSDLRKKLFSTVIQSINNGLIGYTSNARDKLDQSLREVGNLFADVERQSYLTLSVGSVRLDALLKKYNDLDIVNSMVRDPLSGVVVSDRAKLDALKRIASISFDNLKDTDPRSLKNAKIQIGGVFAKAYSLNDDYLLDLNIDDFQKELATSFLMINRVQPNDHGVDLKNQQYQVKTNNTADPYKIEITDINIDKLENAGSIVLKADNFNNAQLEAFTLYQTHSIGNMLGISEESINNLGKLANLLQDSENSEAVKALSKKIFGIEFTAKDLTEIKVNSSEEINFINNKNISISTPDSGDLSFDPLQGKVLLNSIALLAKLGDYNVDIKSPLIDVINNYESFKLIQEYFFADPVEAYALSEIKMAYPPEDKDLKGLAKNLTEHAVRLLGDFKENIKPMSELTVVTNIPQQESERLIARVVPTQWLSTFKGDRNYNISKISNSGVSLKSNMVVKDIEDAINEHLVNGTTGVVASKPVMGQSVIFDSESLIKLTDEQIQLTKNIKYKDIDDVFKGSLEIAINSIPSRIKDKILNKDAGDDVLRVHLLDVVNNENEKPLLRITSAYHPFIDSYTPIQDISVNDLIKNLDKMGNSGFNEKQEIALNNADLSVNLIFSQLLDRVKDSLSVRINKLENTTYYEKAIVHNLKPITTRNNQINEEFLAVARQNFISQIEKISNDSKGVQVDASKVVDYSSLYAINDGGKTLITLVADKERSLRLKNVGFTPVITEISSPSKAQKNLLGVAFEAYSNQENAEGYVQLLKNTPVVKLNNKDVEPVSVVAPFKSNSEVVAAINKEKNTLSNSKDLDKTSFVEKFNTEIEPDDLINKSSVVIKNTLMLDNLWAKQPLSQHIESEHQELDVMMMGNTLRAILPRNLDEFVMHDSYLAKSLAYLKLTKEMHNCVAKSKTMDGFLDNFKVMIKNINIYNPDILKDQVDPVSQKKNTLANFVEFIGKANYFKNSEGLSSSASLNAASKALANDLGMITKAYDTVVHSLSRHENLYSGELSFINYMDGFALNATGNDKENLSKILKARLIEGRADLSPDIGSYQTDKCVVSEYIKNDINLKSPIDFNPSIGLFNFKKEWGFDDVSVAKEVELYQHGLINKASTMMQTVYDKLSDSGIGLPRNALGRNTELLLSNYSAGALTSNILELGKTSSYLDFTSQIVNILINKIEKNEYDFMDSDEKSKFSQLNVNTNSKYSFLSAFIDHNGYAPKTEPAKKLASLYDLIKHGLNEKTQDNVDLNNDQYMAKAKLAEYKKFNEFNDSNNELSFIEKSFAFLHYRTMAEKQDLLLNQIETKFEKLSSKNKVDLYDYSYAADQLDKIMNPPITSSKSVIDSFASDVLDSDYVSELGLTKNDIISQLEYQTANSDSIPEFNLVGEALAVRAAYKFLEILNEHVPESIKNSENYIADVNRYFGINALFEDSNLDLKSEFGIQYLMYNVESSGRLQLNPDELVYKFMHDLLNNKDQDSVERTQALSLISEIVVYLDKNDKAFDNVVNKLNFDYGDQNEI